LPLSVPAHVREGARQDGAIGAARLLPEAITPARPSPYLRLAQSGGGFIVQDATGAAATPIPMQIKLGPRATDEYKFIMVKGLPQGFKMSAGFPTKDAWLVSVTDADGLHLIPDGDFSGELNLQFLLFKGKDSIPETQVVTVRIEPRGGGIGGSVSIPTNASSAPVQPDAQAADNTSAKPKRGVSQDEEDVAMKRAAELLQQADIAAARLLYEVMAMKGSAKAAFAMGQTFDPDFLSQFPIEGLKPNIQQARKWYKQATELGSPEARARLATLGGAQ
jgi:hypothetical protein